MNSSPGFSVSHSQNLSPSFTTTDFPLSRFPASAPRLCLSLKKPPRLRTQTSLEAPPGPHFAPRSTPSGPSLAFCVSSGRNQAFWAHSQRQLAPGNPGWGGRGLTLHKLQSLYPKRNPPGRMRVLEPATPRGFTSSCPLSYSLERGRPGHCTFKILSLPLCTVPTSTSTLRVPAGCKALGWPGGRRVPQRQLGRSGILKPE